MVAESKQIRYKFYYSRHWLRESYVNWNCVCCVHYTPFGYCFLFGKLVSGAVFFEFSTVHQLTGWNFKTTQTFWARQNLHIFIVDLFVLVHPSFCFILLLLFFSRIFLAMLNTRKVIETCNTQGTNTQLNNSSDFLCPREMNNSTKQNNNKKRKKKKSIPTTTTNTKKTISSDKKGALWFGFL